MGDPGEKASDKKHRVASAIEEKAYRFQMKRGLSINEHMNCTKLFIDLINMDVKIDEEDKAVILLNSLSHEKYETFILTLINGRQTLNYTEVSVALVNYEVRRQVKLSSSGVYQQRCRR